MGKLNAPREIPYVFKVVEIDGWVWLYDDSEYTYLCTSTPALFAEPLYPVNGDDMDDWPDAGYFDVGFVALREPVEVGSWPFDTEHKEAWDEAREDAQGNCRI